MITGRHTRRLTAAVAAVLAVGLAAGCSSAGQRGPQAPPQPPPPQLQAFYDQDLAWGACLPFATDPDAEVTFADPRFDCAAMSVPLDYANPTGRSATIGLLRKKATDPARRVGSLVTNPGGPGGSGMELVPALTAVMGNSELAQRFDLVGFDPRGVGASTPAITCFTPAERDGLRAAGESAATPGFMAEKCGTRTDHEVLANIGTRDVARDLDVMRAALGDDRLTYLGFSYGTRIGTAYAEAFPGNVRALVLDGAMDPAQSGTDRMAGQGGGFGRAVTAFAADCAQHADCPLGTERATAEQNLVAIFEQVEKVPARTHDIRRSLTIGDAQSAVVGAMYDPRGWPSLRAALAALKSGDGNPMLAFADKSEGRHPDGTYSHDADAFAAVMCADTPVPAADDEAARHSPCVNWPVAPSGSPHTPSISGLPQVIVISTTGDPATPYRNGVNLAQALDARLVTATGFKHTAALGGSRCVDDAVTRYLVDLAVPAEGTRCDLATS